MDITRHNKSPRMSQAVIHGDTVYLAGQVADDFGAAVDTQTRQILRKLLVGRLIFTPHEDESGRYYVFNGEGALDRILEGTIPVVTRAGFEPAAPCLKGRCSAS